MQYNEYGTVETNEQDNHLCKQILNKFGYVSLLI